MPPNRWRPIAWLLCLQAGVVAEDAVSELLAIAQSVYPKGDKFLKHTYEHIYAHHLGPRRHEKLKFLEIGLGCNMPRMGGRRGDGIGLSVPFWKAYLPNATLWWAEYDAKCVNKRRQSIVDAGIQGVVTGDQSDPEVLARWIHETGGGFDVIVDDGGHTTAQQWATLVGLWPGLLPGGRLFIEDMGASRSPVYRRASGPDAERTMIGIVQQLLADIVEFGVPSAVTENTNAGVHPSALHGAHHLPGLESIHCFAEICVFMKQAANVRWVPPRSPWASTSHSQEQHEG
jgi:hypothetical protein